MRQITAVWIGVLLLSSSALLLFDVTDYAIAANDPIQPPDGGTVEVWGDWEVTDTREYHNCTIIMNGNLIIQELGWLEFHNVTLIMNNTVPEEYIIEIYGNFTVSDWDNNRLTKYDSSLLTSPSKDYFYRVWVDSNWDGYGTFRAFNSIIEYSGGELEIGGHIYHRSAFGINEDCNIHLEGNDISNCSFLMSTYRVTGGKIINNTFSNYIGTLGVTVCNNWTISGNVFIDSSQEFYNFDIIYIEHGRDHMITNNFISSSFYRYGLLLYNVINCTVKGNDICANGESGIFIAGSMNYDCAYNIVTGNNITNNKNGISIGSGNGGTTHNNTIQNNSILGNLGYSIVVTGGVNKDNDARFNFYGTDNQPLIDELIDGDIDYSNHLSHREGNFQYINSTDTWSGDISLDGGVIVNSDLTIDGANVIFNETHGPQFIQVNGDLWVTNASFSSPSSNYSIVYSSPAKGNVVSTSITGQIGVGLNNEGFVMMNCILDSGCLGLYSHIAENLSLIDTEFTSNKKALTLSNIANSSFYNLTFHPHVEDIVDIQSSDSLTFNFINTTGYSPITTPGGPWDDAHIFGYVSNSTFSNFNIECTGQMNDAIRMWGGHNNKLENIFINSEGDGIFFGGMNNTSIMNTTIMNCWDGMFWRENKNCNYVNVSIINCDEGIKGWGGAEYKNNTFMGMQFIENDCAIRFTGFSNITIKKSVIMNNNKGFEFTSNYGGYLIYNNNFINNTVHATASGEIVKWNATYPIGGNYWDNYGGNDLLSGPYPQSIPGSDGIGDTEMVINANNRDYYPLMNPYVETDIPLQEGWNLVSIPICQFNHSIDYVLKNIDGKWDYIQTYGTLNGVWLSNATFKPDLLNDLTTLDHKIGFWINITEPDVTLTVGGYEADSTSISLYAGWNLVGYPSLNTETVANALWGTGADKVEVFDPAEPYRIKEVGPSYILKPCEGYWIHVPADTIWVVDW